MTQFVFMNERIRQKAPRKPVIVCQAKDGTKREANEFALTYKGCVIGRVVYDRKGLPECDTHEVKAWVEFYSDDVAVVDDREPSKPTAREKKPNRSVRLL